MPAVLGVLTGTMFSIMNLFNAQLGQLYGDTYATVLIHIVGLICVLPFTIRCFKNGAKSKAPLWMYIGGALGIITVLTSNLGIMTVGVTVTLVLALLGQLICSMVIDRFGFFGFEKFPFKKEKALSILLIALGAVVMIVW